LGQRIGSKRILALGFQPFIAGLLDWLGGYPERETRNDDEAELVAFDIDALPKGVGSKQHAPTVLFEALNQSSSTHLSLLQ
jgi:hypothetical protein